MPRRADDDFDDDDRPRASPRRGRERVAVPGLLLAVLAGASLAIGSAGVANSFAGQEAQRANFRAQIAAAEAAPANPGRDMQLKMLRGFDQYLTPFVRAILVPSLLFNAVTLGAGLRMRVARNYGLSMAGAICAVIPCSGMCVLTTPVGIWALVTLLDADVKAAFAARRESTRESNGEATS